MIKKRFHIEVRTFTQSRNNQGICLELTGQTTVRLWGAKGIQPQNAFDSLILKGQSLIEEILRASNRVTQPGLKDVRLSSFSPVAFDPTNDNLIELALIFDLTIILELPKGDI